MREAILYACVFIMIALQLLFTKNIYAQAEWDSSVVIFDYHPFPDPDIRFYQQEEGQIFAIQPEILEIRGDTTVMTSFSSMTRRIDGVFNENECFLSDYPWAFRKVEIHPNGDIVFYTQLSSMEELYDSIGQILIKSAAEVGETWIAVPQNIESVEVGAEVSEIFEMEILGEMDTVKKIDFYSEGFEVFNDLYLIIGKHTGLMNLVNLLHFEYSYLEFWDYHDMYSVQDNRILVGKGNAGVRNLTMLEAYDFQVGDIFHISRLTGHTPDDYTRREDIILVLERDDYSDTVEYSVKIQSRITDVINGDTSVSYEQGTEVQYYAADSLFDRLPGKILNYISHLSYNYQSLWNNYDAKLVPSEIGFYNEDENCYKPLIYDGCYTDYLFIRGLGGWYYACFSVFDGTEHGKTLKYFKKGNVEWGEPFDFTVSVLDPESTSAIQVYPNPANNILYVSVEGSDTFAVRIINILGESVLASTSNSDLLQLDMAGIPSGTYVIEIQREGKSVGFEKIIIQ